MVLALLLVLAVARAVPARHSCRGAAAGKAQQLGLPVRVDSMPGAGCTAAGPQVLVVVAMVGAGWVAEAVRADLMCTWGWCWSARVPELPADGRGPCQ